MRESKEKGNGITSERQLHDIGSLWVHLEIGELENVVSVLDIDGGAILGVGDPFFKLKQLAISKVITTGTPSGYCIVTTFLENGVHGWSPSARP